MMAPFVMKLAKLFGWIDNMLIVIRIILVDLVSTLVGRNYAKSWGPRVMIVEFYPEHVGMVPNHACEVLRVNKYRVVGELNGTEFLGNTYNGNYSRPEGETPEYTPEFEDAVIQPEVVDVEFVVSPKLDGIRYNISDWSKGQSTGSLMVRRIKSVNSTSVIRMPPLIISQRNMFQAT